ncbi:MAG: class I SAM-dependent methyltransferase [Pyrinomonadaceae bacterium]
MSSEASNEIKTASRFNSRVADYAAHRPSYPPALVEFVRDELKLTPASVVADVGSGTGLLSELFLRNGNRVFGVEPNAEMRVAAEALLQHYSNFQSVGGTAEQTTLADHSVDFVTAGQAFHWFDAEKAHAEFARILKPEGRVVIVWNLRRRDSTPFLRDYEDLLRRYGTDYQQVVAGYAKEDDLRRLFTAGYGTKRFDNYQDFDLAGLRGRSLSASYVPLAGQPGHEEFLAGLAVLFARHRQGGAIRFEYDTEVYFGRVVSNQ